MLENLPSALGRALSAIRPGTEKLAINDPDVVVPGTPILEVTSPAFADGGPIPKRYTADGEGISPLLRWSDVPDRTAALMLLIEDADSPTPQPLVHAIVYDLPPDARSLEEGALSEPPSDGARAMGRNSYLRTRYLPPDPPPGHGPHRYAFQIFAVDYRPSFSDAPGRGDLIDVLRRHVVAAGSLIGLYERP
jgi:Raf kinase inhibitor-like YbhB/YbcL family protein